MLYYPIQQFLHLVAQCAPKIWERSQGALSVDRWTSTLVKRLGNYKATAHANTCIVLDFQLCSLEQQVATDRYNVSSVPSPELPCLNSSSMCYACWNLEFALVAFSIKFGPSHLYARRMWQNTYPDTFSELAFRTSVSDICVLPSMQLLWVPYLLENCAIFLILTWVCTGHALLQSIHWSLMSKTRLNKLILRIYHVSKPSKFTLCQQ